MFVFLTIANILDKYHQIIPKELQKSKLCYMLDLLQKNKAYKTVVL